MQIIKAQLNKVLRCTFQTLPEHKVSLLLPSALTWVLLSWDLTQAGEPGSSERRCQEIGWQKSSRKGRWAC